PSTTLGASSATCGPRTLSYSGSPPSGVTWYWQTSSSGTSTASPTAYSASTSGTYYLRAKANCGNVWSSGAKSINVTVTPLPAVPVQPSVSDNPCGDKTLERGAPPLGVTWYWQGTNPSGTSTSNTNFSYTASASGTYYIRARDNSTGCWSSSSAGVSVTVTTPGPPYCQSDKLNWNGSEGFAANSSGAEVRTALSRTFLDGLGAELQSQAKNLSFNQVLAVEPIRGRSGRPEAMSLPAPINSPNIGYKYKFITNDLGEPYAADDFDKPNSSGAAGEIDNPRSVANGGAGTLGWYYSTSNNMEPETPVTDYPYSRTYVPEGPSPTESRSTIPGDAHKMGSGHEVKTERAKFTRADLGHYFELKHHFVEESLFENNLLGNPDAASTDGFAANQNVTISHVIQNGETYVKTVSNQASNTPGAWPIGGVIDVQPGAQYTFRVKGHSTTSNAYLFVRQGTGSTNIVWPGAQLPVGSSNEGWVESTFVVPSGVTSVRVGVLFNQPA